MNKKLIAAAVSAAVVAPIAAHAEMSVYGRVNNAIDINDLSGEATTDISNVGSRLGLRGDTEIGGGLTAHGLFEFAVQTDRENHTVKNAGGIQDIRSATVGLSGGFGRVDVGNQWSSYFNTFGTLISPTYSLGYYMYSSIGGGPYRSSNTIKYSNSFGPVSAQLDIRANESNESADVAEKIRGDGFGLGLSFAVTDNITIAMAYDVDRREDGSAMAPMSMLSVDQKQATDADDLPVTEEFGVAADPFYFKDGVLVTDGVVELPVYEFIYTDNNGTPNDPMDDVSYDVEAHYDAAYDGLHDQADNADLVVVSVSDGNAADTAAVAAINPNDLVIADNIADDEVLASIGEATADGFGHDETRLGIAAKASFGNFWASVGWQRFEQDDVSDTTYEGDVDWNDNGVIDPNGPAMGPAVGDEMDFAQTVGASDEVNTIFVYGGGSIGDKTSWLVGYSKADDGKPAVQLTSAFEPAAAIEISPATGDSSQFTWGVYHNFGGGLRAYYEATSVDSENKGYDGAVHLLGLRVDF